MLAEGLNKTLSKIHCVVFGIQKTTHVVNHVGICRLDFSCSYGRKDVFEGCAMHNEFISTPTYITGFLPSIL